MKIYASSMITPEWAADESTTSSRLTSDNLLHTTRTDKRISNSKVTTTPVTSRPDNRHTRTSPLLRRGGLVVSSRTRTRAVIRHLSLVLRAWMARRTSTPVQVAWITARFSPKLRTSFTKRSRPEPGRGKNNSRKSIESNHRISRNTMNSGIESRRDGDRLRKTFMRGGGRTLMKRSIMGNGSKDPATPSTPPSKTGTQNSAETLAAKSA